MLLRSAVGMAAPQATVPALGAAELVGAALEAFATDPELLAAEHARIGILLVDDAQTSRPAGRPVGARAGRRRRAGRARRGSQPGGVRVSRGRPGRCCWTIGGPVGGHWRPAHRCAPAVARAMTGIARLLPGPQPGARASPAPDGPVRLRCGCPGGVGARRGGADRRHAAPGPPRRRRAVVADGGDRPVGAPGRRGPAAGADRGRCAGGAAATHAPLPRQRGRAGAADGAGRHRARPDRRARAGAAHRARSAGSTR